MSGGKDGSLIFFDVGTGQPLLPIKQVGWTVFMAQAADGLQFVTVAQDKSSGSSLALQMAARHTERQRETGRDRNTETETGRRRETVCVCVCVCASRSLSLCSAHLGLLFPPFAHQLLPPLATGPALHLNIFNIFHDHKSDMVMAMTLASPATAVKFAPDGESLYVGARSGIVTVHSIATFQVKGEGGE